MEKEICSFCHCDEVSKKGNAYVCEVCGSVYTKEEFEKLEKSVTENNAAEFKNKKPVWIIVLLLITVAAIVGIFALGNNSKEISVMEPAEEYENSLTDLEFIAALEKSIDERLIVNNGDNSQSDLIVAEDKVLFGFDKKEYSSKEFEKYVLMYFEGLAIQREYGIKVDEVLADDYFIYEEYEKVKNHWNEGAKVRATAMIYFMDNFGAFADLGEYELKMYRAYADPGYWELDDDIDRQMFGANAKIETINDIEYIFYTNNSNTEINIKFWFKFYNGETFVEQLDQEFNNVKPGDTIKIKYLTSDKKHTEKYLGWEFEVA